MKKCNNDELFHVEHFDYPRLRLSKLFFLAILLFIPGCKSEDPNPQLKDPIFLDLTKEFAAAQAGIEKEEKKLEGFEKDFAKSEVRTIDRKSAIRDIGNSKDAIRKYEQQAEYYRIALIKREVEARASYKRAFASDKPWPDKTEYETYEQDKKMHAVSRNWSTRVPKPGNSFNPEEPSKEEADAEGGDKKRAGESEEKKEH